MSKYGIIIHGGAGKTLDASTDKIENALKDVIKSSCLELGDGGTAITVAESAVSTLEDSGLFNAGAGSYTTQHGTVEMDAGIMDGCTMRCGGVGSITSVKNPVSVARKLMDDSPHTLLAGPQASEFAVLAGFSPHRIQSGVISSSVNTQPLKYGTVGATVIDDNSNLAAAVSTGGLPNKLPGRIGDSAVVGSGYYAKNRVGAAVATGDGDVILKACLSKRAVDLMASGILAQKAAEKCISELGSYDDGLGGIITLDWRGNHGVSFNTESMAHQWNFIQYK